MRDIFQIKESYTSIWEELEEKLPVNLNNVDNDRRKKLWRAFDLNNNDLLSYHETEKGVKDVLKLPVLFKIKPVLKMAFNSTKRGQKTRDIFLKDYLEKGLFRRFLLYLRQYYEYWVAFDQIDLDGDRTLSIIEFKVAKDVLERWGIDMSDSAEQWKELDADQSGTVSFDEFCDWAINKNLEKDRLLIEADEE